MLYIYAYIQPGVLACKDECEDVLAGAGPCEG